MLGSARLQHGKIALTLAAALLATACSSDGGDEQKDGTSDAAGAAVEEASASQAEPAAVAWTAKLDVIGQPVEAGPSLLVLARTRGGSVELVSLDRTTGRTNFRMPYHPGGSPTGVTMVPRATETDSGRHLAVLRRYDPQAAGPALVAVDVTTGDVVASTPFAVDDYDACSDGSDVCWSGFESRPGGLIQSPFGMMRDIIPGSAPRRWDLESGRISEKTLQEGAMRVGEPDLFVRGEGRLAQLLRLPGTRRTGWSQSVGFVVGDGVDSTYGWSFAHDDDANVYVGSMGRPLPQELVRRYKRGKRVSIDYSSRYVTSGIDGRTGERLWQREGADAWCPLTRSLSETEARTLCVVSGSRVEVKGEDPTYRDLVVELQGVAPRSGEVAWTYTLAGKEAERAYVDERAPLAPYGVVLPSEDGPVALDQRTGALQLVADDAVLLCSGGPDRVTAYGTKRRAGTLYRTCDPLGRPSKGRLSVFGVSALSGDGDLRYVSMAGRVVAFEVA
ncbi:hypothetical protein GCM10011376_34190 [Nocardioides flavus (ex Wang et al. 2016)]|uniref:PQQ-like domain-containing protein n=1 Tax=Nocardioides flavus (ex Wang et al. 2016) TaxID=2058780 RepID=A0ABQ3HRN0_9ACTN|nr:hypothetical protein [Nocardioides flavus (ex Wang et al. 2016)]GHE18809.1 hypothetical protein GCM10011376_34190 [Nocardioides flavus (ex Wang et al. 2016)]